MRKFVWRLQRVLELKEKAEQSKRLELLRLTEKLALTQGQLLAARRVLNQMIEQLRAMAPSQRLTEQEFFMKYSRTISERINRLSRKVSQLQQQQRAKIAELVKIKRFNEGLQKLRSQAKRRFMERYEKLEQKQSDETATIAFVRRKSGF
jgi:flagellar biosynthesis chaperone FliJ